MKNNVKIIYFKLYKNEILYLLTFINIFKLYLTLGTPRYMKDLLKFNLYRSQF